MAFPQRPHFTEKILIALSERAIQIFGFPVITAAAIDWMAAIIGQRHAVEAGSGPALISDELQAPGVNVTATDPNPPGQPRSDGDSDRYRFTSQLTVIEKLDALTAVELHQPAVLIWSWRGMHPHTDQAVAPFAGDDVIYVGEAEHGCTGSPEFHQILHDKFTIESSFRIPQYHGAHDRCQNFKRRPRPRPAGRQATENHKGTAASWT